MEKMEELLAFADAELENDQEDIALQCSPRSGTASSALNRDALTAALPPTKRRRDDEDSPPGLELSNGDANRTERHQLQSAQQKAARHGRNVDAPSASGGPKQRQQEPSSEPNAAQRRPESSAAPPKAAPARPGFEGQLRHGVPPQKQVPAIVQPVGNGITIEKYSGLRIRCAQLPSLVLWFQILVSILFEMTLLKTKASVMITLKINVFICTLQAIRSLKSPRIYLSFTNMARHAAKSFFLNPGIGLYLASWSRSGCAPLKFDA